GCVRIGAWHGVAVLGRKDDRLPLAFYELAHEALARAVGIYVRGVDEVSTHLAIRLVDLPRFILRRAPTKLVAEGHGAQSRLRHTKPAITQEPVFHVRSPYSMRLRN